jgi:hypothetical protein
MTEQGPSIDGIGWPVATGWSRRLTEALVAALMAAGVDLTKSRSEADIAATIAAKLKG